MCPLKPIKTRPGFFQPRLIPNLNVRKQKRNFRKKKKNEYTENRTKIMSFLFLRNIFFFNLTISQKYKLNMADVKKKMLNGCF